MLPLLVRSPARRMPSNAVAWKKRRPQQVSCRTRRGGKRAQFGLGSGGERRKPRRGKCDSTMCRTQDERVVGKVTSPASAGVIGLGSCVDGERPGRVCQRRPARVKWEPRSRPLHDRAAGMRNRTKRREHSDRRCSGFRGGFRRARLNPSTASRSERALVPVGPTVRRAALDPRRSFPGQGMNPPVFLARNTGKSLKLISVSSNNRADGRVPGPVRPDHLLRCDNNATGSSSARATGSGPGESIA